MLLNTISNNSYLEGLTNSLDMLSKQTLAAPQEQRKSKD